MPSYLITGASSGIGRSLALELASRGATLGLAARRDEALAQLKTQILSAHPSAKVETRELDVTRFADNATVVESVAQALGGLDVLVVNAGIGSTGPIGSGNFDGDRAVIETNVTGAMAIIDAAVVLFRRQGHGRVVVISSVAAARGLPGSASYSASKVAIAMYAEALRAELHGTKIGVTVIYPGFIDTPLNDQMPRRPFLIDSTKGARILADLIDKGVKRSTLPVWPWNVLMPVLRHLPIAMLARASGT